MAKNDNAHALRMAAALRDVVGADTADAFAQAFPLGKTADIEKKFRWAQQGCEALSLQLDADTLLKVREKCICNDGASTAKKLRKYLQQAGSLQGMAELFNAAETFARVEYVSEREVLFCYPQCYCACVKRVEGVLPRAWCWCTVGYAKRVFAQVLDHPVEAQLLESVKTGGKRCAVRIVW